MLNWAYEYCNQARFIAITEDSTFVNRRRVEDLANKEMYTANRVYGNLLFSMRPNHDRKGAHQVTQEDWPWKYFPPFSVSDSLVMSSDVLPRLLLSASVAPNLPKLPKVYLTGVLPLITDVTTVRIENFFLKGE